MDQIIGSAKQLTNGRLTALIVGAAALVAAVAAVFVTLAQPKMSLLFADLSQSDAAQIVASLEQQSVPLEFSADGTSIYVPQDRVARLRMTMAQEGLPAGGTVGYELFDESNALGLTSFMQNISHIRALEGELARTIQSLNAVERARVHLVLGTRDPFSREVPRPTASVVVKMRGAMTLEASQAASIRQLVSSAVPNLNAASVSVLDARIGTVYAVETGEFAGSSSLDSLKRSIEGRLSSAVEQILTPTVGPGKVRVRVAAQLSTDKAVEREVLYDPRSSVIRSRQVVDETERARENADDDPVTVEQNLPEADVDSDITARQQSEIERSEQVLNYEVSSTERERTISPGAVQRLSVSVLVDHARIASPDGSTTSAPRSEEELRQIENLVKSAIGFDASRGDSVTIETMPFIDLDAEFANAPTVDIQQAVVNNLDSIIKAGMLLIFGVVIVLGVVRPAMNRLLMDSAANSNTPDSGELEALPDTEGADNGTGTAELPNDGPPALPKQSMDETLNQMLELRDVDGKVRASSVHKLGQIAGQYPDEVVAILRNWIYEDAA